MTMIKIFAFSNAVIMGLIYFAAVDGGAKRLTLVIYIAVSNLVTLIASVGQVPLLKGITADLAASNSGSSYVKEMQKTPWNFYAALLVVFMVAVSVFEVVAIYSH